MLAAIFRQTGPADEVLSVEEVETPEPRPYTMPRAAVAEAVADVGSALAQGVLSELPIRRFALRDIAAAHDAVEQGAVGKVLVDVP